MASYSIVDDYIRTSRARSRAMVGTEHMPTIEGVGGEYGERLLPQIVDEYARTQPDRIYASLPRTASVSDGYYDVTMLEFANAINGMAWWIETRLGKSTSFETLTYMGASDARYAIIFLAGIKTGYCTLLPSARNSTSGNVALLEETKSIKILHSADMTSKVTDWKFAKPDLNLLLVPSLTEMISSPASTQHYPYTKTFISAIRDPVLICHTSGSTGNPKPIVLPNGTFGVLDNHRKVPLIPGRTNGDYTCYNFTSTTNTRFICTFPPFHVAGMLGLVVFPILYNSTVALPPAETPASGEICSAMLASIPNVRGMFCPPTVLEQLVRVPAGLSQCTNLSFAMFSGGPLAPFAGNALSKIISLFSVIGSTETGTIPALVPLRENWAYFEWNPIYKVDMQPTHDGTNTFEQVFTQDPDLAWIRTVFHTYPEVREWRTKDLFVQHPQNPLLWQFHGRTDDIVVLSNGEKFNPVGMESVILSHPAVSGALIHGHRRFQACLLVEPKDPYPSDPAAFLASLFPTVERANAAGPAMARIFRSKVALTDKSKPFVRAGKGTVVRKRCEALYATEIDALYSSPSKILNVPTLLPSARDPAALREALHASLATFLPQGSSIASGDFFGLGLDSLQTMELSNGLKATLKPHLSPAELRRISPRLVYANPTLEKLTGALMGLLEGNGGGHGGRGKSEEERVRAMREMVERYTKDLPVRRDSVSVSRPSSPSKNAGPVQRVEQLASHLASAAKRTADSIVSTSSAPTTTSTTSNLNVILTGSTGSLGTALLTSLLAAAPAVSTIYCLNRSAAAEARHVRDFAARGLSPSLSRVIFFTAEFGAPRFGLPAGDYAALERNVDVIIHSAWKVDFNHSLESYEEVHIRGVRRFIDLCVSGVRRPRFTFVSSVSSVGNWAAVRPDIGSVPERAFEEGEMGAAQKIGYGESKHVAEEVIAKACVKSGIRADVLRVGQIAGPVKKGGEDGGGGGGRWNESEWMPAMVRTSKALGCVPDRIMPVDWIPVDVLAEIILEICCGGGKRGREEEEEEEEEEGGLGVFNLVNPNVVDWGSLVPAVTAFYPDVKPVSMGEWVERLAETDDEDPGEVAAKPALKILDWFAQQGASLEGTKKAFGYDTEHGRRVSETMKGLPAVSQEWMKRWLQQWSF